MQVQVSQETMRSLVDEKGKLSKMEEQKSITMDDRSGNQRRNRKRRIHFTFRQTGDRLDHRHAFDGFPSAMMAFIALLISGTLPAQPSSARSASPSGASTTAASTGKRFPSPFSSFARCASTPSQPSTASSSKPTSPARKRMAELQSAQQAEDAKYKLVQDPA